MRKILSLGLLALILATSITNAEEKPQFKMNDIQFKDFEGFERKWQLVTVRYRTDSNEQRFTFANEAAIKVLYTGGTDYPDGAVFGKVGIMTEEDKRFPSSKVPAGAMRYQLMVRDKKKYASTGGWGYALFNPQGTRFATDEKTETLACFACHQVVKDRGYVFSEPMALSLGKNAFRPPKDLNELLKFVEKPVSDLPKDLQKQIPTDVKSVRFLEGGIRKHMFGGTLNELRPSLVDQVLRFKRPAIVISEDGSIFSLVKVQDRVVDPAEFQCNSGQRRYVAIQKDPATIPMEGFSFTDFCERAK